jgi:hypothetical protein
VALAAGVAAALTLALAGSARPIVAQLVLPVAGAAIASAAAAGLVAPILRRQRRAGLVVEPRLDEDLTDPFVGLRPGLATPGVASARAREPG